MTTNDRRTCYICRRFPAGGHVNTRSDLHLLQPIGAGHKQDRTSQGRSTISHADRLSQGLTPDTSQGICAEQVGYTSLPVSIYQSSRKQHWPHRTKISICCVILLPLIGSKAIFKMQCRREPQHRVTVVPVARGCLAIADRNKETTGCVHHRPRCTPDAPLTRGRNLVTEHRSPSVRA